MDAERPLRNETVDAEDADHGGEIDVRRLGGMLRRRYRLMLIVFGAVVGLSVLISFLLPPIYEASATLMVEKSSGLNAAASVLGELPLIGGALGDRSSKTQELLLEHPVLIEKAARELGLLAAEQRIDELAYKVDAESDVDSDLLNLKVAGKNPGKAADLANRLVELFMKQSRELAQDAPHRASQYLADQLKQVDKALAESENSLRDYQADVGVADVQAAATAAITHVATLQGQGDIASTSHAAAQQAADYLRRKIAAEHSTYIASSTIARNPVVQKLEADLSTLEAQQAAQGAVHGPEHPEVVKLRKQIDSTTRQLSEAMATVIESQMQAPNPLREELVKELALAEAEVHRTSAQEAAFRSLTGQELAKLKEWPDVATQLGRLKRNAQVASELYVMLMKNYQQMRVNEAIASPGVTVVAQARLPEKPVSPRKKLNVALGGAVGLLLAFLLAALAEALDDRLRSAEETTRRVGLRALGAVPTTTDVAAYLAGEVESGELSDAFAALRVGVRAAAGAVPRVLLVSSAGALEGKSAIAVGLGLALARAGVRTLVVDGDLRREAEAKRLAFPSVGPGLSGVLRGEIEAESAVQPTWAEGLHFLPAGTIPDAPMELLDTPRAATALGALRGSHDCVLIDGPTFTGSTEARLLAGLCEGSLVVVDQTRTRAADVQATADGLSASGAIPLGLVLNRAGHTGPPGSRGRHAAGGALP